MTFMALFAAFVVFTIRALLAEASPMPTSFMHDAGHCAVGQRRRAQLRTE
jgi:hypothetical protein